MSQNEKGEMCIGEVSNFHPTEPEESHSSRYDLLKGIIEDSAKHDEALVKGLKERIIYLESFIKSTLTDEEWGRFVDPSDEFGS